MTLARAWTRQLFGAWGVALLAPVTVIAALVVLALTGGFGGLGALGQLLSGPAVPLSSTAARGSVTHVALPPLLPVVPAASTRPTRPAARRVVAPTTRAPVPTRTGRGSTGAGGHKLVISRGHGATPPPRVPPPASNPPPPPGSGPPPPPAPGPVASIVNQVVALGVSVTSQLPAPVAAIGTGVLESLGQTLDTLLSPQS